MPNGKELADEENNDDTYNMGQITEQENNDDTYNSGATYCIVARSKHHWSRS